MIAASSLEQWKLGLVMGLVALGGVAIGASFLGADRAEAQMTAYRQCVLARQESLDTNGAGQIERIDSAHTIVIPAGWEVIGGSGVSATSNWVGAIVLCRR